MGIMRCRGIAIGCVATVGLLGAVVAAAVGAVELPPGKGAGPRLDSVRAVELTGVDRAAIVRLVAAGYDVASVHGDCVRLYVDRDELAAIAGAGMTPRAVEGPSVAPDTGVARSLGAYNDYADLTAMLRAYATNYPGLCRLSSIGQSVHGRELWALKITTDPDVPADKPTFRYAATIHGNEPLGTELCLYLIDELLTGYAAGDARMVRLVDNIEIWILPLLNPDGRESSPPQRYNANGFDLNRSFPEGSGVNLGNRLYGPALVTSGRQPEVRAVMDWTVEHDFTLCANLHTGSLVANYPYDNDTLGSVDSPTPDDALFEALARCYSSNNPMMWGSREFTDGIVNGAAWYVVSGGVQDWNYRYAGGLEITLELSDDQWPYPAASQLATYWTRNRESMTAYMEWALRGVRGVLRDACTGAPVAGVARVEGSHHLVFSDPAVGDYHRILLPGTYTLWFYAPGYVPRRMSDVTVGSGDATRVDVAMVPAGPRFTAAVSFQPAASARPAGYAADTGLPFGERGDGLAYGWEAVLSTACLLQRNAGRSQDLRYDSLCRTQLDGNHVWELAVPNGPCSVLLAAGDPSAAGSGAYRFDVEGAPLLAATPTSDCRWVEALGTVVVTDGRLTVSNGAGAVDNRLAFVEVNALEPVTLEQWRAVHFAATAPVGEAADEADPDRDGIINFEEYAFGLNPLVADAGPTVRAMRVATNEAVWFGCRFTRNANAGDVDYRVDAGGGSLATAPRWALASERADADGAGGWSGAARVWERATTTGAVVVTVFDSEPIAGETNRYMRLTVSRP